MSVNVEQYVFQRAPLTISIYDESQILNLEEKGTKDHMTRCCEELDIDAIHLTLPTLHRCRGGQAYLDWIERLLLAPDDALSSEEDWKQVYDLFIATSPDDLRRELRQRHNDTVRVGLLASFTRSSGRKRRVNPRDLGKVRVPEANPHIEWLMSPEKEYVPYWVDGESSKLEKCSSIYGCQGFELDYAGVIWGDDMVIRSGEWRVGNPDDCYDTAPGCTPLKKVMRERPEEALRLLRNRYRIMLTRGILGTGVYFEDDETRDFFDRIAP